MIKRQRICDACKEEIPFRTTGNVDLTPGYQIIGRHGNNILTDAEPEVCPTCIQTGIVCKIVKDEHHGEVLSMTPVAVRGTTLRVNVVVAGIPHSMVIPDNTPVERLVRRALDETANVVPVRSNEWELRNIGGAIITTLTQVVDADTVFLSPRVGVGG